MYKLFLIFITIFFNSILADDSIVKPCNEKNLNKLCINEIEIQSENLIPNISYTNSELSFLYKIDIDNTPFLSEVTIKDSTGNILTKVIDNTNADKFFKKLYKFDTNSFIINETISGSDIDTRVTKYEHGTMDNNYAIKTINPLNQIEINIYDNNNNILKNIDINGLETVNQYNGDGKIIKRVEPNNIITTFTYSTSDLIPNSIYKTTQISESKPTVIKFFDTNDKVIATYTEGFDGRFIVNDLTGNYFPYFKGENKYTAINEINSVDDNLEYKYNCLGYKTKITDTQSSKVKYLTYDLLNRVTKEETIRSNNEETKESIYYVYDRASYGEGKLSYIKSNSYKKEFFYNELSQLKATKEYIGNQIFSNQYFYSPDGKLEKTITPNGFEIVNEYNRFGYLCAVKTPKTIQSELNTENIEEILKNNLNEELIIFKEYLDIKTKIKIYGLKKAIYTELSNIYEDGEIKEQLNETVTLLDKTIELLNNIMREYEKALNSYENIIENYILPQATNKNTEDNFQNLYTIFQEKSIEYKNLGTAYLDTANILLEEIIKNPELLNDKLNYNKELVMHYKDISSSAIDKTNTMAALSNNYWIKYLDIKNGNVQTDTTTYSGMFNDSDYKYFYKILEQNASNEISKSIYGNAVVITNEYDLSNNKITRITIGYYGKDDIKDVKYKYNEDGKMVKTFDVKKSFTKILNFDASNKLTRAVNIGSNYYTNISYIYENQDIYQFNRNEHSYTNIVNNLKVNTGKEYNIQDNDIAIDSSYSPNKDTYKKTISNLNDTLNNYYKIGKNFKYTIKDNISTYKNLIYANNTLVAINIQNKIENFSLPINYYIHNDIDGSLDIITNDSALIEEKVYYRPYGQLTDKSWIKSENPNNITNIGYKGFEHDMVFNLIDFNSYPYDPNYAKVLTDDVFENSLQAEEMSQNIESLTTYSNTLISETPPEDTGKIWYKPDLIKGGMDILTYQDTSWNKIGTTGNLDEDGEVTVNTLNELTDLSCFKGDKGFISLSGDKKIAYKCNNAGSWDLGGSFEGTFNIIDLATTYFNALEGTSITAVADNGEFPEEKIFIKKGNNWIDTSGNYFVFDNLNNILSNQTFSTSNIVFFPKNSINYYSLTRYSLDTLGDKWIYNSLSGEVNFNNSEIINAIPEISISSMYDDIPNTAIVSNKLYEKEFDSLNRPIYKRADGIYISKSSDLIPSVYVVNSNVSLPPSYDASTLRINEGKILLDNRTQATDWIDAPNGAEISISGINEIFTHRAMNNTDFWTDNNNGDGQINATEVFTRGSRSSLPEITHNITALTKIVGSEPNYTGTGIVSAIDNKFKQWFYSTSGTIINNLLDGMPANIYYNNNNAGTYPVYPNTGKRVDNNQRWVSNVCVSVTWAYNSYVKSNVQARCNANSSSTINNSSIIIWKSNSTTWYGRYHSWDNSNRNMAKISYGNKWIN